MNRGCEQLPGVPDEILLHIFSYLTHAELWVNTRGVSRQWRNVTFDTRLWKNAWFTKNGEAPLTMAVDIVGVHSVRFHNRQTGPVFRVKADQIPLMAWLFDRCQQLMRPTILVAHWRSTYYTSRKSIVDAQAKENKNEGVVCVHQVRGDDAWYPRKAREAARKEHYCRCVSLWDYHYMDQKSCPKGKHYRRPLTDEDFKHTTNHPCDMAKTLSGIFGKRRYNVFRDRRYQTSGIKESRRKSRQRKYLTLETF